MGDELTQLEEAFFQLRRAKKAVYAALPNLNCALAFQVDGLKGQEKELLAIGVKLQEMSNQILALIHQS